LGEAFAASDLQTLLVDYTRLFLGPGQPLAAPYGSCWLNAPAQAEGIPSLAVLDLYGAGGFEISEECRELPDHVAVELEFLYLLTFKRNEAKRGGQTDELNAFEQLGRQFVGECLGSWIGPFAAAVKAGAETDFYRQLAVMTERFVGMEGARLGTVH
jgi:putative dimethyl sulfoxide reductase chaperone